MSKSRFTDALELKRYTLVMQDYGGPVGFRLALSNPERIEALVVQNAVAHEAGLGPLWQTRKAFWNDRATHEAALRANLLSFEATRLRHVGRSPNAERYPLWQRYLEERQPAMLVLWGKYDPSFEVEGAHAYRANVPGAEVHLLEGGHFVLDEAVDQAAALMVQFLGARVAR